MAFPKDRAAIVTRRARDRAKKPEAFAVERDGAVEFVGPFTNNAECWRQIDRNRTTQIDRAEDLQRAARLLTDALDELGYSLRIPGEFPIPRATAQRLEENITRAIKLFTKIGVE
jgi:hypothetical protein